MLKEIEVKILDINPKEITSRLENLSAVFIGDNIQRIYTYDLIPISADFLSVKKILTGGYGEKEKDLAAQKLALLLMDVIDLLSDQDKHKLLRIINADSWNNFLKSILTLRIPPIIFENEFEKIITKYHTNPNKWVRLRETGDKTTISLKQIYNRKSRGGVRHHSIEDVKEIEIEIDDLKKGKELLKELGYFHKNFQEKRRISYSLQGGVNVDIDFWPMIPPYLEIEADRKVKVYRTLDKLGFKRSEARILNADDVYTFYGLDMYSYKELRF